MDDSSASTSADPLILPSSPLGRHQSPLKSNAKPLRSRSPNKQQFSSPAKSFIMDTGDGGNEQSPWRIKVTVQAEPRNGPSPGKLLGKTMTVPLKGGSSSPAKRPARRKKVPEAEESEMEVEIKRPQRKRKGTPIRRGAKRPSPAKPTQDEVANTTEDILHTPAVASPTKKPAKRKGRKSLGTMPTQRGQRLSQARDELDEALQEAVGGEDGEADDFGGDMPVSEAMQGDMTAMNEDFTMISVETLQSMKQNTSMLEDSQIGEESVVNGSYWPSSPPDTHNSARASAEKRSSGKRVDYPNISAQAQYARDTPAKSFVQAFDAMSWKPTGRAVQEPTPADSSELQHSSAKKTERTQGQSEHDQGRQASSQQAPSEHVSEPENEAEAQLGAEEDVDDDQQGAQGEDDIWAEEASRSLEEDVDSSRLSQRSHQQQQPPHYHKSANADNLNDLFSGLSSKPPRAKIPRTWRRSSGMDFTYSDSPAHSFAQEEEQMKGAAGASGSDEDDAAERGSGVLTPPSTDEDEEGAAEEGDGEDDDPDMRASRSTFEPDAAATELQLGKARQEQDGDDEAESDGSALSPDGEDTGLFWQSNLPNVYQRPTRPRLADQRKARDLSSLLRDDDSSRIEKQPSPQVRMPPPAQPAKRFPGSRLLAARREAASSSFTSTSSAEQTQPQPTKDKVVSSPLRKSLLKSSKVGGAVTAGKATEAAVEETRHERRQPMPPRALNKVRRERLDDSVEETSTSFASKASDQRQLLTETAATPQVRPQHRDTGDARTGPSPVEDASLGQAAAREDDMEEEALSPAQSVDYSAAGEVQYTDDYESDVDEEEQLDDGPDTSQRIEDTTRSYEERLNLSSPQKIRVNFGDSSHATAESSNLLQAKRSYPPLFSASNARPPSRGHQHERTLIPKPQPSEPGLLGNLTSTFWSAVVRPSGPTTFTEPVFPSSLRAQLRSRYGVLSNQHPWTYAHMRTLHRMMNSCATGKADSLVPLAGTMDLPSSLATFVGKKGLKDVCGRPFQLTEQLAHVVWSLMQTLVEPSLIEAMEKGEIDFIGDSMARACRGYFDKYRGKARHGGDVVFQDGEIKGRRPQVGEEVGAEWVVRCLGACVFAQGVFEGRD